MFQSCHLYWMIWKISPTIKNKLYKHGDDWQKIIVPNKYEQMPCKIESTWIKYLSAGAHGIITPSIDLLGFQCSKQPHQETVTLKAHCDSFCQHRDLWCLHEKSPQPTVPAILPSHSECECSSLQEVAPHFQDQWNILEDRCKYTRYNDLFKTFFVGIASRDTLSITSQHGAWTELIWVEFKNIFRKPTSTGVTWSWCNMM